MATSGNGTTPVDLDQIEDAVKATLIDDPAPGPGELIAERLKQNVKNIEMTIADRLRQLRDEIDTLIRANSGRASKICDILDDYSGFARSTVESADIMRDSVGVLKKEVEDAEPRLLALAPTVTLSHH